MKKLLIAVTPEQKRWLKTRAKKLGITVTEFLRRLVDKDRGTL